MAPNRPFSFGSQNLEFFFEPFIILIPIPENGNGMYRIS
ncbi:hypothetical protein LEP1GSC079_2237 [Leptospira interrogans str. FPW1039]|uniref:Uncharacterized protein n=1 Tax=Leptospira interrogans str. FPW1039 TaxID=1193040 RepID=A0A0F6IEN8_LEPIR|nr:hypothetical protein LEP1GSC045_1833 [Leptospira interrogans serovar Pomona str. Kennewicki LC82-25]EKN98457.1 hypothetical protein LEP1GSC014_1964 [Leptospira interrogans serovar Pomona str. Pomona]EKR34178.1 hypothetical protein LEP1GSC096_2839 [Leptospira interrogans serovar Hebdomadis str. R499]EMF32491.1 hypothetical protein LEP1GSC201_1347 [Leptospira interrogans serovar Pomona str. Fox 32256]EMI63419.1 hypothetical protein LEP1GSC200_1337 [Leptospira interrogans serovar Pomona str. CS